MLDLFLKQKKKYFLISFKNNQNIKEKKRKKKQKENGRDKKNTQRKV